MGAGCSSRKSTRVADSVQSVKDINDLTKQAKDFVSSHREVIVVDHEKLKRMVEEKQQKDEDVSDMDAQPEDDKQNTFRELWVAAEINNSERVAAFLDTYEEKFGSELQETQLYDSNGNSVIHKAASLGHAEVLM